MYIQHLTMDKEVSGLWVAKFEASSKEGNSNNSGDNVTTKTLQGKTRGIKLEKYRNRKYIYSM